MDEENKKKYSDYNLKDLLLGLISSSLLLPISIINLINPFGFVNGVIENDGIKRIIVYIVLFIIAISFVLYMIYFIFYLLKIKLNIFFNEVITVVYVIPLVANILLILGTFFSVVEVSGRSMEPNFYNKEKIAIINYSNIDIDDVIIIENGDEYIIKRVVAKEGDIIDTTNNIVTVNGIIVEGNSETCFVKYNNYELKKGEYYVLGDNRSNSSDSRVYGIFDETKIKGKFLFKITKEK